MDNLSPSTYPHKERLLGNIDQAIYYAQELIDQKSGTLNFESFKTTYTFIYEILKKEAVAIAIGNPILASKIEHLPKFKNKSGWKTTGILGFVGNYFFERRDIDNIREIHKTLSVIQMLIKNG